MSIIDLFINELFPSDFKCVICNKELDKHKHYAICDECYKQLPFIKGQTCQVCGKQIKSDSNICINCKNGYNYFDANYSVFKYSDQVVNLIRHFKYDNCKYLKDSIASFIIAKLSTLDIEIDYIIPVPMYYDKMVKRGYNQTELIAQSINEKLGIEVRNDVLVKYQDTMSQAELTKEQRMANVIDTFYVYDKKAVKNKNILLIDDVFTTGSTINECARMLKLSGATKVYSMTFANGNNNNDIK